MKPLTILLADDSYGDQQLVSLALKNSDNVNLVMVSNGTDATQFLQKTGKYTGAPNPSLVILDLNLPARNGIEILETLRVDPLLKQVPAVIFTGSQETPTIKELCSHDENFFVAKPLGIDPYFAVVRTLEEYSREVSDIPANQKTAAAKKLRGILAAAA